MSRPVTPYEKAVRRFGLENECWSKEDVMANPLCMEIAKRFNKTIEEVAKDINWDYIQSYREPEGNMIDVFEDEAAYEDD